MMLLWYYDIMTLYAHLRFVITSQYSNVLFSKKSCFSSKQETDLWILICFVVQVKMVFINRWILGELYWSVNGYWLKWLSVKTIKCGLKEIDFRSWAKRKKSFWKLLVYLSMCDHFSRKQALKGESVHCFGLHIIPWLCFITTVVYYRCWQKAVFRLHIFWTSDKSFRNHVTFTYSQVFITIGE